MRPFAIELVNNTLSCHIYASTRFPNDFFLTYETCPETYDNKTIKVIRFCCMELMFSMIEDSIYKKTQDFLRYHSSSVLVGPAVLFNVLSLIVLSRFKRLKGSAQISTTFYMKCLCILDTLTIVSKFVYEVIVVRNGLRAHPLVITSFLCKFLGFAECLCAVSAIYVLIAMSIDKLICVVAPLKVGQILTRHKAHVIFSCILLIAALMASYNLFDRRVFVLNSDIEDDDATAPTPSAQPHGSEHHSNNSTLYHHLGSNVTELPQNKSQSQPTTQHNEATAAAHRISYDCDSNWPELKNDWILFNNIVRVFLPILLLCVCNSWIGIALAKARRNTEALFNAVDQQATAAVNRKRQQRLSSSTSSTHSFIPSHMRIKLTKSSSSSSSPNNRLLKPTTTTTIRKHSADDYLNYDSDKRVVDLPSPPTPTPTPTLRPQNSPPRRRMSDSTQNRRLTFLAAASSNVSSSTQRPSGNIHIRGQKSTHHISIMLFAVSIGFVILNLPFAIRTLFHRQYQEDFKKAVRYEFFTSLTHLLLDLNYIANFFLYFFSGSKFRAQLFAMFGCCGVSHSRATTIVTANNVPQPPPAANHAAAAVLRRQASIDLDDDADTSSHSTSSWYMRFFSKCFFWKSKSNAHNHGRGRHNKCNPNEKISLSNRPITHNFCNIKKF